MKAPSGGGSAAASRANTSAASEGEAKKSINGELWQACAGPLVNLPAAGSHVVYFPQGHSEQVAASMKKDMDVQIPSYPNLPSKLLCILHSIRLHADPDTDEVYAQMTLQPTPSFDKDALLRSDLSMRTNKPQMEFFCKTLTASDTSTHGGFSVPRRAAEKIFPALDFTMQPPAQELVARDLHDNVWTFRHIYRGQPKRHLLTTGWSLFVSGKRLIAGDSVLFIRDEKQQLLLGIRRANRQPTNLSSSVLSSDSMHIGILAAAAHAATNNSPFTVFYNPRASPSEFVIPLAKYYKAVCSNQISLGMRFRMMFETEESGTRRYMGTITGISDLDPARWKNSQWRNLQVGWDESTAGEKRNRVSIWEIEPVTAPFFICPSPPFFRQKRPRQPDDAYSDLDVLFRRTMPWLGDDFVSKEPQALPGMSLAQWMHMQQNSPLANSIQTNYMNPLPGSAVQNLSGMDISQLGLPAMQVGQHNNQSTERTNHSAQDQLQKLPSSSLNPLGTIMSPQKQMNDASLHPPQNLVCQNMPTSMPVSQVPAQILQSQGPMQAPSALTQQQQSLINEQPQRNVPQNMSHLQQQISGQSSLPFQHDVLSQQLHGSENQIQLQLLQRIHQQQNSLVSQQPGMAQSSLTQMADQQKQIMDIPQGFCRSISTTPVMDASQATTSMQQWTRNDGQNSLGFGQLHLQGKMPQQQQSGMFSESQGLVGGPLNPTNNQFSAGSSGILAAAAGAGPSAVTEDLPSCSYSPSTNNCPNASLSMMITSSAQEPMCSNNNLLKEFQSKADVKASLNISKSNKQGFFTSDMYPNPTGGQMDYLDSQSSATSVLSQNDAHVSQNNNSLSFNPPPVHFRDESHEMDVHGDARNSFLFGSTVENQLAVSMMSDPSMARNMLGSAKEFSTNLSPGGSMVPTYDNPKEPRPGFSSSMVSPRSFGVQDMTFNSIDSTVNDSSFMNRGSWSQPQVPRMRTYTKVYKRGAVGRSIDITSYSGYDELKQDMARRFGIEGQLEDGQRIGWKLVYVDHENDVLLVGDDPWEEFVNCVRCIKILSPQEVQQMSLDGDFGRNMTPKQACSSSDNVVS